VIVVNEAVRAMTATDLLALAIFGGKRLLANCSGAQLHDTLIQIKLVDRATFPTQFTDQE